MGTRRCHAARCWRPWWRPAFRYPHHRQAAYSLEILGAPTGATIALVRSVTSGALDAAAPGVSFRLWRDTDDLRAGIVSGNSKLFSTPTHVPANLANRGMPLKLLCLLGMGHLTVLTADEKITSFADLAGKPVLGFFKNDMPDLVFRACAKMEGLDPDKDIRLSYVQTGMEASQMLAAGVSPRLSFQSRRQRRQS